MSAATLTRPRQWGKYAKRAAHVRAYLSRTREAVVVLALFAAGGEDQRRLVARVTRDLEV